MKFEVDLVSAPAGAKPAAERGSVKVRVGATTRTMVRC